MPDTADPRTTPRLIESTEALGVGAEGADDDAEWFPDEVGPLYLPSPAEIAAECAAIRATWSAAEHRRRRSWEQRVPWKLPGENQGHAITGRDVIAGL